MPCAPEPSPEYFLDNYGQCSLGPGRCTCLINREPWKGRGCPRWMPNGATSFKELLAKAKSLHEARRGEDRYGNKV